MYTGDKEMVEVAMYLRRGYLRKQGIEKSSVRKLQGKEQRRRTIKLRLKSCKAINPHYFNIKLYCTCLEMTGIYFF